MRPSQSHGEFSTCELLKNTIVNSTNRSGSEGVDGIEERVKKRARVREKDRYMVREREGEGERNK